MRLTGKYRYLTFEDRKKIEAWHLLGDRPVDIAARLSVHHTTIYKELQRGATGALDANQREGYSAELAERRLRESFKRRGKRAPAAQYRSSIPRKAFEEFVKDIITGENRATAFRYEASPICRASFPSTLDEDGARCTVEVTVYRLNAVAVTAFMLDGPETLLRHIGLDERDTYTTKHEIDDLVTVVHITREEAPAWQH